MLVDSICNNTKPDVVITVNSNDFTMTHLLRADNLAKE